MPADANGMLFHLPLPLPVGQALKLAVATGEKKGLFLSRVS